MWWSRSWNAEESAIAASAHNHTEADDEEMNSTKSLLAFLGEFITEEDEVMTTFFILF